MLSMAAGAWNQREKEPVIMRKQKSTEGQQFLDEIRELNKLIETWKSQLEIEKSMLINTSVRYKDIQVQSSGSRNMMEEKMPEIVDGINKLENHIKELIKKRTLAMSIIKEMNTRMQTVLLLYYIQGKTLEQIAEEMGRSYTWIWSEKRAAVEDFSKKFKKMIKVNKSV